MRLLVLTFAIFLTACGHMEPSGNREPLAANLRAPCPDQPPLTAGTGDVVTSYLLLTKSMYLECQAKHKRTVEAYENPTKETK